MKNHVMAWRNVLRNKRRSALSAFAIAIAAMSILLLFSLLTGLLVEMRENLQRYYFGEIRLRHSEFDKNANLNPLHLSVENASDILGDLRQQGSFTALGGRIQFPAAVYRDGEDTGILATGLQLDEDPMRLGEHIVDGRLPRDGAREVVLGSRLATSLDLEIGEKFTAVTMTLRRASNGMTLEIVGIVSFPLNDLNNAAYLSLETAQRFLKMGDRVVDIMLRTGPELNASSAAEATRETLAKYQVGGVNEGVIAEVWNEIPSAYAFLQIGQVVYYIIGAIFYLLASTVIINTIMMIIFERTKEIGTLASMGMEGKSIVRMFFMESLFISTIGSVLGAIVGSVLTLILERTGIDFTDALGGIDFQISGIMYPKLTLGNIIIATLTGIVVASGISLLPSRRAAKIKPVEAMKTV